MNIGVDSYMNIIDEVKDFVAEVERGTYPY